MDPLSEEAGWGLSEIYMSGGGACACAMMFRSATQYCAYLISAVCYDVLQHGDAQRVCSDHFTLQSNQHVFDLNRAEHSLRMCRQG